MSDVGVSPPSDLDPVPPHSPVAPADGALGGLPLLGVPVKTTTAPRACFRTKYLRSLAKGALLFHKWVRCGALPVNEASPVGFRTEGRIPPISLLFTTATGLFHFDGARGGVKRLATGKAYGLTGRNGEVHLVKIDDSGPKSWRFSDIYRLHLDSAANVRAAERVIIGIPGEVHQIDIAAGQLVIPHTAYEQVLFCPLDRLRAGTRPLSFVELEVVGFDIAARSHLNSCFFDPSNERYFFVAHNSSAHTGRTSELLIYHPRSAVTWRIPTDTRSAHNVALLDDALYYCDSDRGRLMVDAEPVFQCPKLLRGLSITAEHVVLGGSDISFDRSVRNSSTPTLYFLDRRFRLLGTAHFPDLGDVYEIRQLGATDLACGAAGGTL